MALQSILKMGMLLTASNVLSSLLRPSTKDLHNAFRLRSELIEESRLIIRVSKSGQLINKVGKIADFGLK